MKRWIWLPICSLAMAGIFGQRAQAQGLLSGAGCCPDQPCSHLSSLKHGHSDLAVVPDPVCKEAKRVNFQLEYRTVCVAVPQTRYRYKRMLVIKKKPIKVCLPECAKGPGCCPSGKTVQVDSVQTVCYWACVKVPYTVYCRVKKTICIKKPCIEKVPVTVNRCKCERCCQPQPCKSCPSTCQAPAGCKASAPAPAPAPAPAK